MPTGITYSDAVIADRLQAFTRGLDSGSGPGQLKIYDGTRPNSGAAITTQKLLVTAFFAKPSSAGVVNGVLSFDVDETPVTCVDSGVATWARFENSAGTFLADTDVGVSGSGKGVELSKVQLYLGGEVTVTLGTMVEV